MFDNITPLIIAYNEAENIQRTVDKVAWARRIVVVDSGSTDETINILKSYPHVEIFNHPFADFASQCNYGIAQIATAWVLSLDADYELSDDLVAELQSLIPAETTGGYRTKFIYRVFGRPLRGTLYPPRVVLFRKDRAIYHNEGHGHRVSVPGPILSLRAPIYHDDRKPLARWFSSQKRYAYEDAVHLLSTDPALLSTADRIRLAAWPAPLAVLIYTLFVKRCVLDGWPGWFYALQRMLAETLLALEIINKRMQARI